MASSPRPAGILDLTADMIANHIERRHDGHVCRVCENRVAWTDPKSTEGHISGSKHKKKLAEWKRKHGPRHVDLGNTGTNGAPSASVASHQPRTGNDRRTMTRELQPGDYAHVTNHVRADSTRAGSIALPANTAVYVTYVGLGDDELGWILVETRLGDGGWVPAAELDLIPPPPRRTPPT